jgi:hypothetical protein
MGWTGGGAKPVADPNIGIAQKQLADLSTEQWNMFKTDIYPTLLAQTKKAESRSDEIWAKDKEIADFNLEQAKKSTKRYEETAIPAMDKLKADADLYNTAGYQEQMAGQAIGDIASAQEVARQDQAMRDRAYGIDPTSGRSAGAANANNVQAALAKASAATQTREAAKALGLQKQANVYNMAAGLPMQSLQQSGAAVNAGGAGLAAGQTAQNATMAASGATNAAGGSAMQGWGQVGNIGVGKYRADIDAYTARSNANPWNTIIGAATGVATAKAMGSDRRLKTDIKQVGTLDNGLPVYSYRYKAGGPTMLGVMADEVQVVRPEAYIQNGIDGHYDAVDYAKL